MITFLILVAPVPLFLIYLTVRTRLRRRKQADSASQFPPPGAKPYEPAAPAPANAFLRLFPLTTQLYLRQQWGLARFGFCISAWIFTVILCGSLIPPLSDKLPTLDQRAWLSFVTGLSASAAGLTALLALFTAVIASSGIVTGSAVFTRTRPISLRAIFWGRVLSALAALLLAAAVSIALGFTALRVAYGPVWNSTSSSATATSSTPLRLVRLDDDETTQQAVARRLLWLNQHPAPRIVASSLTTMVLAFSVFLLLFCQPFGHRKKSSPGIARWIIPFATVATVFFIDLLKDKSGHHASLGHVAQLLFYNTPFQAPPPWQYLPIPIALSIALLFLSAFLYRSRDI